MMYSETARTHERGLARFLTPEYRARFRESLASPKRRDKVLEKLHHFRHLDLRYATAVPSNRQRSRFVASELRARGAPEMCYVVSNEPDLDGRELPLDEALAAILDEGLPMGTFVSCLPGRLAYFHDEEIESRYILGRPR